MRDEGSDTGGRIRREHILGGRQNIFARLHALNPSLKKKKTEDRRFMFLACQKSILVSEGLLEKS